MASILLLKLAAVVQRLSRIPTKRWVKGLAAVSYRENMFRMVINRCACSAHLDTFETYQSAQDWRPAMTSLRFSMTFSGTSSGGSVAAMTCASFSSSCMRIPYSELAVDVLDGSLADLKGRLQSRDLTTVFRSAHLLPADTRKSTTFFVPAL